MKKFPVTLIASLLGLYLLSTGASWVAFSFLRSEPGDEARVERTADGKLKIDPGLPRTEACPINGAMYSKPVREVWETRRPIAAIVENHADSRPPMGIASADVVYEAVAEGGITRFLNIFYCGSSQEEVKIAPVRSARIYFINWAQEYGDKPIFMHVGGANDFGGTNDTAKDARALEYLQKIEWRVPGGNDFDTTFDSGYPVFWRDYERLGHQIATEHTMTASLDEAYAEAAERGFVFKDKEGNAWNENFISWNFEDGKKLDTAKYEKISFDFWDNKPDYSVVWKYNSSENKYLRENGGKEHIDLSTNSALSASNVVIQFVKEKGPVDRNIHMLYTTIGEGTALVFNNGDVTDAIWKKQSATSRTRFYDKKGKELSFVRGVIWIEAVPTGNKIEY